MYTKSQNIHWWNPFAIREVFQWLMRFLRVCGQLISNKFEWAWYNGGATNAWVYTNISIAQNLWAMISTKVRVKTSLCTQCRYFSTKMLDLCFACESHNSRLRVLLNDLTTIAEVGLDKLFCLHKHSYKWWICIFCRCWQKSQIFLSIP